MTYCCRLLLAVTFLFSGLAKGIDPHGTEYKIGDYLVSFGLDGWYPDGFPLLLGMVLAAVEFYVGLCLLFGMNRRFASWMSLFIMAFMTPLTLYIALVNPVTDCGCFGDVLVLTNWQTFFKNIILLAAAIVLWKKHNFKVVRLISANTQWLISLYGLLFIFLLEMHSLYYLPVADFTAYRNGTNIPEQMEVPEGAEEPEFESTFILEKDGVQKEFTLDDYPDSTWTFVDTKTKQIKEGYVPPIHDFVLTDVETGEDKTQELLDREGYTFLLIAYDLKKAEQASFDQINELYDYCQTNGYGFEALTASGDEAMAQWRYETGAEYPFWNADGTMLKTMVRSNPGLVLIKGGTILNKWSRNDFPTEGFTDRLEKLPVDHSGENQASRFGGMVLLFFALPLCVIMLLDRVWTGLQWIGKLRKKSKLINPLKQKKMRKKIVAGNWKMNKNLQEGCALAQELTEVVKEPKCGVIICTPFIHLASVAQIVNGSAIELGAENCADKEKGAFTGEVSAEMVKSTGAQYVILGHSERREYYNETPEILKAKVDLALANGLKVIFCIGESLAQREANEQEAVCKAELAGSVFHLTPEQWANVVIAYEPIWAIGTGKTATAEQAEEIHAYIRGCVAEVYGAKVADDTTILYGGSCKASNAPELFAKPDIDGGLIGGASLKAADFKGIIDAFN